MKRLFGKIGTVAAFVLVQNAFAGPNFFTGGFWAGIEVEGASLEEVALVRSLVPIQKDTPFSISSAEEEAWCGSVQKAIPQKEAKCSVFSVSTGERYFTVQLISKDQKLAYRNIPPIPKNMNLMFPEQLFQTGGAFATRLDDWNVKTAEFCTNGYSDYSDPVLHELADQLAILVPRYQEILFNILQYSPNSEDRWHAAYLLSWAQDPDTLRKVVDLDLLSDPHGGVRNYIARSMHCIIPQVKDPVVIEQAVGAFCKLAQLPTNTDRNKGLAALQDLLEEHPQARSMLDSACRKNIYELAQISVIRSVGGFAKNIQALLQENQQI